MPDVTIHHGDCLEVLATLPDNSVDSIVTDPPYGLGFMGKAWDDLPPGIDFAREALRVLKPGGHLLAFGGTRTWHRLAVAVEDAGFEIRDSIAWLYGSGFPKSLDVSKAIDKRGGNSGLAAEIGAAIKAARESRGWTVTRADRHFCGGSTNWTWFEGRKGVCRPPTLVDFARLAAEWPELAPYAEKVAEAAREVVGESPHSANRATNIGYGSDLDAEGRRTVTAPATEAAQQWAGWGTALKPAFEPIVVGRKPLQGTVAANVQEWGTGALNIDGSRIEGEPWKAHRATGLGSVKFFTEGAAPEIDKAPHDGGRWPANVILDESQAAALDGQGAPIETNGASRFFYCAKAPKRERPVVDGVAHPTVKPLALMRYLVRLVTPPGGTVLEPFAGSGATVEAAILEGFDCIAIEREAEYLPLIQARIDRAA